MALKKQKVERQTVSPDRGGSVVVKPGQSRAEALAEQDKQTKREVKGDVDKS
jgi:hypothetical protein